MAKERVIKLQITDQEYNDVLSAMSFFIREFPDKKNNPKTMKAMEKLNKKLWKVFKGAE